MAEEVLFFGTPDGFRKWLEENHHKKDVQWIGYYKAATGKPSMTWEESVREALCFGWIDGLRKSIDDESYKIRFTPRKPNSHWSDKNIRMVEELIAEGNMKEPGLKKFEKRNEKNSRRASYEQESGKLKEEYEKQIRQNQKAWKFFEELAAGYTKISVHWVMSAKREDTRQRRLKVLIESCENGEKIPLLKN